MTWESFGVASRELAVMVAKSGYEPDIILAIARGGLLAAGALGYALSVKNTYTMNVEFYTGVDERLEVPRILPPAPDFVDLGDAKILIADDVADNLGAHGFGVSFHPHHKVRALNLGISGPVFNFGGGGNCPPGSIPCTKMGSSIARLA